MHISSIRFLHTKGYIVRALLVVFTVTSRKTDSVVGWETCGSPVDVIFDNLVASSVAAVELTVELTFRRLRLVVPIGGVCVAVTVSVVNVVFASVVVNV